MPRTLDSLVLEVLADEFDATKYGGFIKTWLNESAQKLSRSIELPSQETTSTISLVAGTQSYSLPADTDVVLGIRRLTYMPLREVSVQTLDDVDDGAVGDPEAFAIYGNSVIFYPTPKTAYNLTVRRLVGVVDMVNGNDTLNIPDDYAPVIIDYARAKAFQMEDDFEAANYHWARWERGRMEARMEIQTRSRGRIYQTQGMMLDTVGPPNFRRP